MNNHDNIHTSSPPDESLPIVDSPLRACGLASPMPPPRAGWVQRHAGLPDVLGTHDGHGITDKAEWLSHRRPELIALFQHDMYGPMPGLPNRAEARLLRANAECFDGKATLREIALDWANVTLNPSSARDHHPLGRTAGAQLTSVTVDPLHLLLVVPNRRTGPVPAFVGMAFCGNHAVIDDPAVAVTRAWMYADQDGVVDHRATEAGRGAQVDVWNVERIIDRGYAIATFYCGDVTPDHPAIPTLGGLADCGTIMAWAWGFSRVLDYMTTVSEVDPERIAVVGHSRMGKAALLAGALDDRVALIVAHQSGCGGAAPSRTNVTLDPSSARARHRLDDSASAQLTTVGETIEQANNNFPHWFNARFKQFNGQPERLPFDQHCLIALAAPRPVLLSNAVDDPWANPRGQFDMLKAASPVYNLFGDPGLTSDRYPDPGTLIDSRLGYFLRAGGHAMTAEDWDAFLTYVDRHLRY